MSLLNSSELCLFTHTRDSQGRKELSVLDYVFVLTDLYQQVKSTLIDEQQLFTPWRKLKKGKRFSDHRAVKIQVDLEFSKLSNASKRTKVWNFNNPQSWNKFHELTKSEQLFGVWSPNSDTETCYRQWKCQLSSVLGKRFSKKNRQQATV